MARYLDENGLALLINNYLKPEDEYSLSSGHPVQNKVLTQTFGNLLSIIDYSKVTGYFHYANAAALPTVNSTGQEEGDFEYNPEKQLKIGQRAILDDTQAVMEISAIDSETGAITWINTGLSFGGQVIQVETIPTASAAEEGKIYQYIGATNLSFTNGRFYRCVSDGAASPSYNWEEVEFGDGTPHWSGTRAEYEAIKDTLEAGTYVSITDDYDDGLEVVDVVEEDNMNPVTSNAVAGLFAFENISFSISVAAQGRGYTYINIPSKTGYTAMLTSLKDLDTPIDLAGIMVYTCLNQSTGKCLVVVHNDITSTQTITGIVTVMYVKN